jgi:hypothetical protein
MSGVFIQLVPAISTEYGLASLTNIWFGYFIHATQHSRYLRLALALSRGT